MAGYHRMMRNKTTICQPGEEKKDFNIFFGKHVDRIEQSHSIDSICHQEDIRRFCLVNMLVKYKRRT